MKIKKLVAFVLASVMSLSALTLSVSAADSYTYEKDGSTYLVTVLSDGRKVTVKLPTTKVTNSNESKFYELTDADKEATIAHIAKMKYYNKNITSKAITSNESWISVYQYAAAQGAKSLTFKYAKNSGVRYSTVDAAYGSCISTITSSGFYSKTWMFDTAEDNTLASISSLVYAYRYKDKSALLNINKQEYYSEWDTQKLYDKSVSILNECGVEDSDLSDMEKTYNIAKWLQTNVTYTDIAYLPGSMYSAIVEQRATCDGYASAYTLLMRMAGMKCWNVQGYAPNGGRHAWNVIRVNGELRFVDTSWLTVNQKKNNTTFTYTYEEMEALGYTFDATKEQLEVCCVY
jgi:transglutaminase/protease-like cytokinesis protein 3